MRRLDGMCSVVDRECERTSPPNPSAECVTNRDVLPNPESSPVPSPLPPALVEILVCPQSKTSLIYFPQGESNDDVAKGFLLSVASRLRYRIDAGVPVMLVEEAMELPVEAVERLVSRARELGIASR